jgi:hypothetical protein
MSRDDGYEVTTQPRRRNPYGVSHFAIVEREGEDPDRPPPTSVNTCRDCRAEGPSMVLHADPDNNDPRRVICGKCQGEANLRSMLERRGGR